MQQKGRTAVLHTSKFKFLDRISQMLAGERSNARSFARSGEKNSQWFWEKCQGTLVKLCQEK
jgi:hypothetical protein